MEKLKVVHIVEDLHVGGVERIVETIAHATKAKYDLEVWCAYEGGSIADRLCNSGVTVKIFGIKSYYNIFQLIRLSRLLKKKNVDVLHCHGYFAATVGRIAGVLASTKCLINHVHTTFHNLKWYNVMIDKILNKYTKNIIFISKEIEQTFLDAGYRPSSKYAIIYNGIDAGDVVERHYHNPSKTLICVASLFEHKGHHYLLHAFKRVLERYPEVKLQCVGKGILEDQLHQAVGELGIEEQVDFLGERDDVINLLSKAHIFVLASLREGVPVSVIEAMASKLPIIASNVGGLKEMVTDQLSGILCEPKNINDLEEAIDQLLGSPDKCESLGEMAHEVYQEKFTAEHMIKQIDELYTKGVETNV